MAEEFKISEFYLFMCPLKLKDDCIFMLTRGVSCEYYFMEKPGPYLYKRQKNK